MRNALVPVAALMAVGLTSACMDEPAMDAEVLGLPDFDTKADGETKPPQARYLVADILEGANNVEMYSVNIHRSLEPHPAGDEWEEVDVNLAFHPLGTTTALARFIRIEGTNQMELWKDGTFLRAYQFRNREDSLELRWPEPDAVWTRFDAIYSPKVSLALADEPNQWEVVSDSDPALCGVARLHTKGAGEVSPHYAAGLLHATQPVACEVTLKNCRYSPGPYHDCRIELRSRSGGLERTFEVRDDEGAVVHAEVMRNFHMTVDRDAGEAQQCDSSGECDVAGNAASTHTFSLSLGTVAFSRSYVK